ncbi:MAG: hypothetical protein HC871_14275, partial [Rhizobiales bacterium]|nr:hypothetical protein [Hyphomicrobiales bacterium]
MHQPGDDDLARNEAREKVEPGLALAEKAVLEAVEGVEIDLLQRQSREGQPACHDRFGIVHQAHILKVFPEPDRGRRTGGAATGYDKQRFSARPDHRERGLRHGCGAHADTVPKPAIVLKETAENVEIGLGMRPEIMRVPPEMKDRPGLRGRAHLALQAG